MLYFFVLNYCCFGENKNKKIIDPSISRKIKLCCELRFRYSFVHKLLYLIYDNVLVDLWLGLFVPCGSMTINGWEMMIPLAFFAGTG